MNCIDSPTTLSETVWSKSFLAKPIIPTQTSLRVIKGDKKNYLKFKNITYLVLSQKHKVNKSTGLRTVAM